MELQGKIKMIDETKTYGNNGFRKREMVITTEEQGCQNTAAHGHQGIHGNQAGNAFNALGAHDVKTEPADTQNP